MLAPPMPSRFPKEVVTIATTGLTADEARFSAPVSLKRAVDEPANRDQKTRKLHHKSTPGGGGPQNKASEG